MSAETFHDLFLDELKDLYDAENRLVKALPKLAKAAQNKTLKSGLLAHLEETKGHVERLERVFEGLGKKAKAKTCLAMKGLVKEGAEALDADEGPVRDAQIIGAAQRVEHYEIAAYGTVIAMARIMGHDNEAQLLQQTLEEEGAADKKLTAVSRVVNTTAFQKAPGM